jgi:hypothetical protein
MSPYAALVLGLAILGGTAIVAITFRYTPVTLDEISPIDGKVYLGRTYAFDHWTGKMKPAAHSYGTITTAGLRRFYKHRSGPLLQYSTSALANRLTNQDGVL